MRAIIVVGSLFLLLFVSCSFQGTPKCTDEDVKEIVADILLKNAREDALDGKMWLFGLSSIRHQYDYDKLNELKDTDDKFRKIIEAIDSKINKSMFYVDNVKTINISKEIKKCECKANLILNNKPMLIKYTAQLNEGGNLNVILSDQKQ